MKSSNGATSRWPFSLAFRLAPMNKFLSDTPSASRALCICQAPTIQKSDTHESSSCSIDRLSKLVSKLAWADQECPIGKWPKLV